MSSNAVMDDCYIKLFTIEKDKNKESEPGNGPLKIDTVHVHFRCRLKLDKIDT